MEQFLYNDHSGTVPPNHPTKVNEIMKYLLTALLTSPSTQNDLLAPMTGDINIMIIVAVILIAAFLIFVLLKGGKKRD